MGRERMSAVDAAWLQMDTAENRMIITSLMEFDEPLEPALLDALLRKLSAHSRFHQRVVPATSPLALPRWEDDPRFDVRAHVHHVGLPRPGGGDELRAFVGERMSAGLSAEKPLWEVDVVDRAGGSALLLRVHHCMGDGVALVRLLLSLAEEEAPPPPAVGRPETRISGPLQWVRLQAARAKSLAELIAVPFDPRLLRVRRGLVKRAAWSEPIPLAAVQDLARRHDATVNDVLMAALAGGLRTALLRKGSLPERELRALVPLYLRGAESAIGNHFGLVFVKLPVAKETRDARIAEFKARMGVVKATPTSPVAFDVLRAFGAAGAAVERLGVSFFTAKASVMVTNVPGPRQRVRIAGQTLRSMMTWAPTSGFLAMSATLLSYGGEVRVGIYCDAHVPLEPAELVRDVERELAEDASAQAPALH